MKRLLAPALFALAGTAHALPPVKTLAQFDLGYARCEARYAHMKGQGDDAYLVLWKIRPDAQQRDALARQRSTAAYRSERAKAQKTMAKPSPKLDEKLERQCQATWSELQRNAAPAGAAASNPAAPTPKK
ncbi:MAG TPA: hypothetical protein VGD46_11860 [Rhizobacter sp.]